MLSKKLCMFLSVILILVTASCTKNEKPKIIIGSKNFTEQVLLGEMMSILLEAKAEVQVEHKFNLGGTFICHNALKGGDIDIYAEYTGTALTAILEKEVIAEPEKAYETIKKMYLEKFNLVWLKPFGFNNTYTLTMRSDQAEKDGIKSITDLKKLKDTLIPGFTSEFLERPDGYPALIKHYDFEFKNKVREMDPGLMYIAMREKEVDIICGFATDGRIPAFNLVMLEDDKSFFPSYYAAPVVQKEILDKHPKIAGILNQLNEKIDDVTMAGLNYQVDEKGEKPEEVALQFLKKIGLMQ
ncbi:MAG: glycine betaine ABC transporter substrate-binding protein [bacterium]